MEKLPITKEFAKQLMDALRDAGLQLMREGNKELIRCTFDHMKERIGEEKTIEWFKKNNIDYEN